MTTDDERRDVARRLRELPTDMYEVEELWEMKGLDTCCKDQTDYYLIHFALFECFPVDHMPLCDYEELHMRLADLIEPEPERTCTMEYDAVHCDYVCTHCGERYYTMMYEAVVGDDDRVDFKPMRFCPNCGVRFKEDDDDNR